MLSLLRRRDECCERSTSIISKLIFFTFVHCNVQEQMMKKTMEFCALMDSHNSDILIVFNRKTAGRWHNVQRSEDFYSQASFYILRKKLWCFQSLTV
ncbi:unnamed protein product [Heterobilharzia americana]|nr:unnamed protein product [Heterobilharzia americana]